jgi:HK97 family phage major capsid protein
MDRDDRDIIGKADQGTPLSGDAGGTNWQYAMPAYIYEETILRTLGTASEVIPLVQQFPMRGRVHRWPVEGSVKMSWGTYLTYDTSDKGEVVPSITYKDVTSYTWGRYVGVADELLDDTFLEIAAVLRDQAIKTLKVLIEQQLLNAASPNTGALTATTNRYTMGGAGFQDINYDECIAAMQELATQEYRQGTVYIMHPTVWDVIATDKDAVGRYYWNPDMVVPRSIRGTPVYVADGMPDIDDSAVSTPFVLLVDPKTILYGVRMGMAIRFFDATIYAVTNDESFWRFMTRFGTALGIVDKCIAIQTKA